MINVFSVGVPRLPVVYQDPLTRESCISCTFHPSRHLSLVLDVLRRIC